MERDLAEKMLAAAEKCDIEARIYEEYSGRSMYGRSTTGIVIDSERELRQIVYQLGFDIGRYTEEDEESTNVDFRTDNLGRDMIVY